MALNYPAYVEVVMSNPKENIEKELDRLMTKIMRIQAHYNDKKIDPELRNLIFN